MSAPVLLSSVPEPNDTNIVLGTNIVLTFDQAIDTTTLTDATFSLTAPLQGGVLTTPEEMQRNPLLGPQQEYIPGIFSFSPDNTTATFTISRPLRPGVVYTILIVGADATLTANSVANPAGEKMAQSYQFSFTTGILDLAIPPPQSPLPYQFARIDINEIIVRPTAAEGNDVTKSIELIFPGPIDITSFDPTDVEVGVEAILNDLHVRVPQGLTSAISVDGNTMTVIISGWPTEPEYKWDW
jgi:hypothetical protein